MQTMAEMIRTLLVIIILASFLELLLPSGAMRPYVRLAIGLFVLVAILNPALRLLFAQDALQISSWDLSSYGDNSPAEVLKRGDELQQKIVESGLDNMKPKLQGQINAVAILVPGVDEVDSTVWLNQDGSIKRVTLEVSCSEGPEAESSSLVFDGQRESLQPELEARLYKVIENMFALKPEQIKIQMKGGT